MTDIPDWLRGMAAPRRNHFYFGKMMGVAQFEQEQRYGLGQRWLNNRLTLGTGILCGLEVGLASDGHRIAIKCGAAVDPLGRDIIIPNGIDWDPFEAPSDCGGTPAPTTAGTYHLCLSYRECAADPQAVQQSDDCRGVPACEHDTTIETFRLSLAPIGSEAASSFACDQWLVPVSTGGLETPPQMADIAARLAAMLKGGCPPLAGGTCVVLGTVTISGDAVKGLKPAGRRYLYSQAQLLDMILCLGQKVAACCGTDHDVPPPTTAADTLKITKLSFWRLPEGDRVVDPTLLGPQPDSTEVLPHTPLSDPLVLDAGRRSSSSGTIGMRDEVSWTPLLVRVAFNKAVDGTTLVSIPGQPVRPVGLELSVLETDAVTGLPVENPVSTFAFLEDANVLLVMCPGAPSVYTITLLGDPTTDQPAVRSWDADPTRRQRLDGEVPPLPARVPSGNNVEGGDFTISFEIRVAPAPPLPAVTGVDLVMDTGELRDLAALTPPLSFTSAELVGFHAAFGADVSEDSLRSGVVVTVVANAVSASVDGTLALEPRGFTFMPTAPFVPGDYTVTLTGAGDVATREDFVFAFRITS